MRHRFFIIISAMIAAWSAPAAAEVVAASEAGFALHYETTVATSVQRAWAGIAEPDRWWNAEHTYSGDPANLTLDPVAGGCLCEVLPRTSGSDLGSVEHMRVVYVDPRVNTLRLAGALGPLQAEALTGALTIKVEPADSGAKLTWDYVVGGYARMSLEQFALVVDGVVGEQFARLAASLDEGGW